MAVTAVHASAAAAASASATAAAAAVWLLLLRVASAAATASTTFDKRDGPKRGGWGHEETRQLALVE